MKQTLNGKYVSHIERCRGADGSVAKNWDKIVAGHKDEFPSIERCFPGTFNVWITEPENYMPPYEDRYRSLSAIFWGRPEGHHISPVIKILKINDEDVECWVYRGGHRGQPVLELLSEDNLLEKLRIEPDALVVLELIVVPEGTPGMPALPGPV